MIVFFPAHRLTAGRLATSRSAGNAFSVKSVTLSRLAWRNDLDHRMQLPTSTSTHKPGEPALPRDSLGCVSEALRYDQALAAGDLSFFRKGSLTERVSQVVTPASARGFLAGVSLMEGHRRRIFHPNQANTHEFEAGSIYVRNFQDDYKADLSGTFDFVLIELPPHFIERTALELGCPPRSRAAPCGGAARSRAGPPRPGTTADPCAA